MKHKCGSLSRTRNKKSSACPLVIGPDSDTDLRRRPLLLRRRRRRRRRHLVCPAE